jgi:hypothetical protein
MPELYAVLSQVQGPDGNGLLLPSDPALGGQRGSATTTDATPTKATGGFVPPDLQTTTIVAVIQARVGAAGSPPTDSWSCLLKGTCFRNGNTLTQVAAGTSSNVESTPGLTSIKAGWLVDTSVTPNAFVPQVTGKAGTNITWSWNSTAIFSI